MGTLYEQDVMAWASEKRELASRMALLLAHLLKWQYQPGRRGNSGSRTIKEQRKALAAALRQTPSLNATFTDPDWLFCRRGDRWSSKQKIPLRHR